MFIGEYEHSVDAKGRVIMPAKLREDIGEKFIVTKGLDGCLFAYSQTEWSNFEEKLKTLPLTNKNARDFVRFFLSGAVECEIDKPDGSEYFDYLPTTAEEKLVKEMIAEKIKEEYSQTPEEFCKEMQPKGQTMS